MPVNRNALIRYRTLDNCLRNPFKKWTLEDLIDACSDALYEYEGIDKGVSKRTVQMDLQTMRSDKLGYNAPILVLEKKYYAYADPAYSITNIPLTEQDLSKLTEVTEILRQFKGFSHFQELSGMVNRLEDKIHTAKTHQESIIDFEKNENLKGLEHIDKLYKAIQQKTSLKIEYQSFKARSASTFSFCAYLLKEYRNRWFVLGRITGSKTNMLLALDRIESIGLLPREIFKPADFNVHDYFKHVVGVTVNQGLAVENVILFVERENAPYILTKPIHPSQKHIETLNNGIVISVDVQINFEFEREILGFGSRIKVLAPKTFKRRLKSLIKENLEQYEWELDANRLEKLKNRINKQGSDILENIYSKKEVDKMKHRVHQFIKHQKSENPQEAIAVRQLLRNIPELWPIIFNVKLEKLLKEVAPNASLTKAIYFDKPQHNNWYVTWHQDITINVKEKIDLEGYAGWTQKEDFHSVCPPEEILHNTFTIRIHLDDSTEHNGSLKILPGSHKKRLKDQEIALIISNSNPMICNIKRGGVQLMKPLLLHASSKSNSTNPRRVIHLEFCSAALPGGMEWSEALLKSV